jgi:hypothetical protein
METRIVEVRYRSKKRKGKTNRKSKIVDKRLIKFLEEG